MPTVYNGSRCTPAIPLADRKVLLPQAGNFISLVLTDHRSDDFSAYESQQEFAAVFALRSSSVAAAKAGITLIQPEISIGRGVLRRLEFFAEPEQLPHMIAPLLVRQLWRRGDVGNVVISYAGVPIERLVATKTMLDNSCEAVLLRQYDVRSSYVAGLARTRRNERLIDHWADCIERFSSDSEQKEQFDQHIGSSIVNYLCDRVGTLKYKGPQAVSTKITAITPNTHIKQLCRMGVRKLLTKFPYLLDDPIGKAQLILNLPAADVEQDVGNLVTYLMNFIWLERADLQSAFNLRRQKDRQAFVDWFLSRAPVEHAVTDAFLAPVRSERAAPSKVAARGKRKDDPPAEPFDGVNLIGYPRAEMGMGEQLRGCAAALSTMNLEVAIKEFDFGLTASRQDTSYEHLIRNDNRFHINLFHINADQMLMAWDKLSPEFFRNHYNIAYWEWELSNFPDQWLTSIDLVDEIWSPSRFIQDAVVKKTNKPVIWMPLAVEFPLPAQQDSTGDVRSKFGLPAESFLFLFTFDFSSFSARKNFAASIKAFKAAFPSGTNDVGLVLKTNRRAHQLREFWDLLEATGDDLRIHVIDRVLRQKDMRELMASCDSFVSLHRSEGFGLGIAEAMYLGKPVIATNYSGNLDFTKSDNSYLVDFELIPVKPGEYPFAEGQVWADPNVLQAAAYMRQIVENHEYAKSVGLAASKYMRQQHSCKAIGNRYLTRIRQIASARALLTQNEGIMKSLVIGSE